MLKSIFLWLLSIVALLAATYPLLVAFLALTGNDKDLSGLFYLGAGLAGLAFSIAVNPLSKKIFSPLRAPKTQFSICAFSVGIAIFMMVAQEKYSSERSDPLSILNRNSTARMLEHYGADHKIGIKASETAYYVGCLTSYRDQFRIANGEEKLGEYGPYTADNIIEYIKTYDTEPKVATVLDFHNREQLTETLLNTCHRHSSEHFAKIVIAKSSQGVGNTDNLFIQEAWNGIPGDEDGGSKYRDINSYLRTRRFAEALPLLQKVSNEGEPKAQWILGALYCVGVPSALPRDDMQCVKWMTLGDKKVSDYPNRTLYALAQARLTLQEIVAAQKAAADWKPGQSSIPIEAASNSVGMALPADNAAAKVPQPLPLSAEKSAATGFSKAKEAEHFQSSTVAGGDGSKCAQIANRTDKLVCSDPFLSALDARLKALYRRARANAADPGTVGSDQEVWQSQRDACSNSACLTNVYQHRIAELRLWAE